VYLALICIVGDSQW